MPRLPSTHGRKRKRTSPDLITPPTPTVNPPTSPTANAGDTEVDLAWSASTTPVIDAYHIEVSAVSGSGGFTEVTTVSGSTLVYTHTGRTNGVQLWYRVRARQGAIYSTYSAVVTATPIAPGSVTVNSIAPGALILRETFDSIGVYLPYTGDDNENAVVTMEFSNDGGFNWRDGLPMWRAVGSNEGVPVRHWTGSVVECDHGTEYAVRVNITDADNVNGASSITQFRTTRSDNEIPNFAAMLAAGENDPTYPKRYVTASGGVTTGTGRTAATAWTMAKAMSTAADATDYLDPLLNDGAGDRRMLIHMLPGDYDGPFVRTLASPITILASPAVSYTHNADPQLATWTVTSTTNHAVIRQPAARRSAPGDGMWELVSLTGPGMHGMTPGIEYDCYRWLGATNANIKHVAISDTARGQTTCIPVMKRSSNASVPTSTAAGWLEFYQRNLNWNLVDNNAFGAFVTAAGDIYLRLPGNKVLGDPGDDPDDYHVMMGITAASGAAIRMRSDCHVYGVHFRGWDQGVRMESLASRYIVSHCLMYSGRWAVYEVGTKNTAPTPDQYGTKGLIQYCYGRQTSRWRTSIADESSVEWRMVKSKPYGFNEVQLNNSRNFEPFESHLVFGAGGGQQRTTRYCYVEGFFNGLAEAQNSTGGWDMWASAYQDNYGCFIRYCPDESMEPEGQAIEQRYWNNYAEHCSLPVGGSPFQWGNIWFWRNRWFMTGNHGTKPPNRPDLADNSHQPGMAIVKYDGGANPPGRVHFYHNVVWTHTRPEIGGSSVGHHGPFQIGGGGVYNPAFVLANNIFRLTGRIADAHASPGMPLDEAWWEDHNFWASAALDIAGNNASPEMRVDGRGFWLSKDAVGSTGTTYLEEMENHPAGWRAENVNKLDGVDYTYQDYDVIDDNLEDAENGDLSLSVGSLFIDAGKVIPNISDVYEGAAPDMGWKETE